MTRIRRSLLTALLLLSAVLPGCHLIPLRRKPHAANVPPPPKPVVTQPVATPPPAKPQVAVLTEPPQLSQQPDLRQALNLPQPKLPAYRARRVRGGEHKPAAEAPAEASASPAPAIPQLEQVLTPQQQQDYNASIDRNITRAQRTVNQLNGRRLSRNQNIYLARIRAYIQQASDARKSDLVRAADWAERASVLADDLLKSVQ